MRPVHLRRLAVPADNGPYETGLAEHELEGVTGFVERLAIFGERGRHALLGVVEEAEVAAVAAGVRLRVERGAPGQVAVGCARAAQDAEKLALKTGQGHRRWAISHAVRSPCLISPSATHSTSGRSRATTVVVTKGPSHSLAIK